MCNKDVKLNLDLPDEKIEYRRYVRRIYLYVYLLPPNIIQLIETSSNGNSRCGSSSTYVFKSVGEGVG